MFTADLLTGGILALLYLLAVASPLSLSFKYLGPLIVLEVCSGVRGRVTAENALFVHFIAQQCISYDCWQYVANSLEFIHFKSKTCRSDRHVNFRVIDILRLLGFP